MLQSMGSQRFRHNLATEQQQICQRAYLRVACLVLHHVCVVQTLCCVARVYCQLDQSLPPLSMAGDGSISTRQMILHKCTVQSHLNYFLKTQETFDTENKCEA